MNKLLKIAIILAILLASSSVFYYFVIYIPQREKERQEIQTREITTSRILLQACLDEVNGRLASLPDTLKGKSLSDDAVKLLLDMFQKQKDECFRKYPQK